jgi:hypothetical protein
MSTRRLPMTFEEVVEALGGFELFGISVWLDADTGRVLEVPQDVLDYCAGRVEGTDLQLSDSFDLPAAQAVADELRWLEQGFDEEGLPFGPGDRRFFPLPRLGDQDEKERARAATEWLAQQDLQPAE